MIMLLKGGWLPAQTATSYDIVAGHHDVAEILDPGIGKDGLSSLFMLF